MLMAKNPKIRLAIHSLLSIHSPSIALALNHTLNLQAEIHRFKRQVSIKTTAIL